MMQCKGNFRDAAPPQWCYMRHFHSRLCPSRGYRINAAPTEQVLSSISQQQTVTFHSLFRERNGYNHPRQDADGYIRSLLLLVSLKRTTSRAPKLKERRTSVLATGGITRGSWWAHISYNTKSDVPRSCVRCIRISCCYPVTVAV